MAFLSLPMKIIYLYESVEVLIGAKRKRRDNFQLFTLPSLDGTIIRLLGGACHLVVHNLVANHNETNHLPAWFGFLLRSFDKFVAHG